MDYLTQLADEIRCAAGDPDGDLALYRIYAVLARTKGAGTTLEDVHDAWSAWRAATNPEHRSLIPFDQLTPQVQALDEPYQRAIRQCAPKREEQIWQKLHRLQQAARR